MPRLSKTDRDNLQSLLEAHSKLLEVEDKIGKRGVAIDISITNIHINSDFTSVAIDPKFAREALMQQRAKVERELAAYGIIPR